MGDFCKQCRRSAGGGEEGGGRKVEGGGRRVEGGGWRVVLPRGGGPFNLPRKPRRWEGQDEKTLKKKTNGDSGAGNKIRTSSLLLIE